MWILRPPMLSHPEAQRWIWALKLSLPRQNEAPSLCNCPFHHVTVLFRPIPIFPQIWEAFWDPNWPCINRKIQWISISYFSPVQRLIFRNPWCLEQVCNHWYCKYTSSESFWFHTVQRLDHSEPMFTTSADQLCLGEEKERRNYIYSSTLGRPLIAIILYAKGDMNTDFVLFLYRRLSLVVNAATPQFDNITFFSGTKANSHF